MNNKLSIIIASVALSSLYSGICAADDAQSDMVKAQNGDAAAELRLAHRYEIGDGVPKDPRLVYIWINEAASRGYAPAEFAIGVMYENGRRYFQKSDVDAMSWYQKALSHGYTDAQANIDHLIAINPQLKPAPKQTNNDRVITGVPANFDECTMKYAHDYYIANHSPDPMAFIGASLKMNQVLIEPDNSVRVIQGILVDYDKGLGLIDIDKKGGSAYFSTAKDTLWFNKNNISIGSVINILGKYVSNENATFKTPGITKTVKALHLIAICASP